jgi:hypothetical protein
MDDKLPIIVAVVVIVIALVGFLLTKKSSPSGSSAAAGAKDSKNVKVKAKLVWLEASEGPFDTAFEYQARKEIKNSKLRYHLQTIVDAWAKRKCRGLIVKHPAGRETQVLRFKEGQKVDKSPYLGVDYVSFTSDRRRTLLFLEGLKYEELECDDEIFELARKNILVYSDGGRKTCPKSNLAFRETFIAPTQKKE